MTHSLRVSNHVYDTRHALRGASGAPAAEGGVFRPESANDLTLAGLAARSTASCGYRGRDPAAPPFRETAIDIAHHCPDIGKARADHGWDFAVERRAGFLRSLRARHLERRQAYVLVAQA